MNTVAEQAAEQVSQQAIIRAVDRAKAVLAAHLKALNAGAGAALAATLHLPHHRLSAGVLRTWPDADHCLADFLRVRLMAGITLVWDQSKVMAAGPDNVPLDVHCARLRRADSVLDRFRSLRVLAGITGKWAAQRPSSFAASINFAHAQQIACAA